MPKHTDFSAGLEQTIAWYRDHEAWWRPGEGSHRAALRQAGSVEGVLMALEYEKELGVQTTDIPGLLVFDLAVHGDARGWFKENWQRAKMCALGLPDFGPVQNNISFNAERGVTRGIHAEPWDKYISIGCGSVFGAWVDLRPRRHLWPRVHVRARSFARHLCAARRGQRLPGA